MPRGLEVRINPELLVWARETAGFMASEAAEKLKVPPERLKKWESGIQSPTLGKLRRAAEIYKRPTAIFYLPEPPETPAPPHDFRATGEAPGKYSPMLLLEIRKARHRREIALDLLDELDEESLPFELRATTRDDPDVVAAGIRDMLGISTRDQFTWKDGYQALRTWRSAIEEQGVLVFHTSSNRWHKIDVEEMRGLSIIEDKLPVILINSGDGLHGRIFTLMHEFVHLLIHNGGVCDLRDYDRPASNEKSVEVFCNRVSGAALVPAYDLLDQKIVLEKEEEVWTDAELGKLGRRFRVSNEVILRRLLMLGRTTQSFYEEKRKQFLKEYSRPKTTDKPPAIPYYRVGLRNNGIAYTKLVFRAYYDEYITTADVSDYLGVKVKHLKDMEREAMRGI